MPQVANMFNKILKILLHQKVFEKLSLFYTYDKTCLLWYFVSSYRKEKELRKTDFLVNRKFVDFKIIFELWIP